MAFYKLIASSIGDAAGPFVIKNQAGVVIATGVTREQLLAGYAFNVPAGSTSVVVTNVATNTTCTTNQTFPVPNYGVWEMQVGTTETIRDHYGLNAAAYTAPVSSFVPVDIVGIYGGVVSGAGAWTIKGGPEPVAGTTYNGGGLLVVTGSNQPQGGTTIQTGAHVQLGLNTNAYSGSIAYPTTVQTGAVLDIVGANAVGSQRSTLQDLNNAGTVNVTGPGRCGEGRFLQNGILNNTGTINIDDAMFVHSQAWNASATGTINVADGGTFARGSVDYVPATQTTNISGCGLCDGPFTYGAIYIVADASQAWQGKINLLADSCIGFAASADSAFSGQLTGSNTLKLLNATGGNAGATASFTNGTNTFSGTMYSEISLYNNAALALQYAKVVLGPNGKIQQGSNFTVGSLASDLTTASVTTDGRIVTIAANGVTTYKGTFGNSTPGTIGTINLEGGSANELTITAGGAAYNFSVNGGARLIMPSGTWGDPTWGGVMNVNSGSTISGGDGTAGVIRQLNMTSAKLEVNYPIPAGGASKLTATFLAVSGGYTVDVPDVMPAGTYDILTVTSTSNTTALPATGVNNTGKTVTYAWSSTTAFPRTLRMTLA